jgi:hypothetical protein
MEEEMLIKPYNRVTIIEATAKDVIKDVEKNQVLGLIVKPKAKMQAEDEYVSSVSLY